MNNPTLGDFCDTMIGRADIEESKSNVAMNAWLPQASYPCFNATGLTLVESITSQAGNRLPAGPHLICGPTHGLTAGLYGLRVDRETRWFTQIVDLAAFTTN